MMAVIVLTDNDVYTVPQRIETGIVLVGVLFLTLPPATFFRCDPSGDRSTGRVRPRPGNGNQFFALWQWKIVLTALGVGGWTAALR